MNETKNAHIAEKKSIPKRKNVNIAEKRLTMQANPLKKP